MREIDQLLRIKAEDKALSLLTSVDKGLKHDLLGDEDRIKKVILNLADNAIKFTEKGKVRHRCNTSGRRYKRINPSIHHQGHRHWHCQRPAEPDFPKFRTARFVAHTTLWWQRTRPGDLSPFGANDGRHN